MDRNGAVNGQRKRVCVQNDCKMILEFPIPLFSGLWYNGIVQKPLEEKNVLKKMVKSLKDEAAKNRKGVIE